MIRKKLHINTPSDILKMKAIFTEAGHDLLLVGGCVRDSLLGIQPKDWDLVTDAMPDTIISILKNRPFVTNILETGKNFGVINVITHSDEYEIAVYRTDGNYTDGRRPDGVSFADIESDAQRRDLSINALYFDLSTNEVLDYVGGIADLEAGIVRTVGSPEDRFRDDELRKIRVIRFASRFDSKLDQQVIDALKRDSSMSRVSPERIRDEFLKGIKASKSVVNFMSLLKEFRFFDSIFPNLVFNNRFIESKDVIVQLAWLLIPNFRSLDVKKIKQALNKLTYSTDEIKAITFLMELSMLSIDTAFELKKLQEHSGVSDAQISEFGALLGLDSNLVDTFIGFRLTVSGNDLISKGMKPGKEMGDEIKRIETLNFKNSL
jgi:tRNA nucleotidyltransferase (CCA-adding enzyme)